MKYHNFFLVFICLCLSGITSALYAQVPCNARVIENVDFSYNAGVAPARWNVSQTNPRGFLIDQTAYNYVTTGSFSNPNLNPSGGTNNATRQYAIVSNPNTLSPQFANMATDGMIVINPKQGENDQYATYTINGLVPGNVYTVEIKVWNVIDMAMPGACGQWCNWNDQLLVDWAGNGNNAHDGLGAMNWTGTNGSGGWNGYGNQIDKIMKISAGGASAVMTGVVTLADATTGFTLTFKKGASVNPIVLGIDYIKVYGCSEEVLNVSGGTTNVCEGTDITLTAQGLGSAGSSYSWYKDDVLLPGRNTDTLNVFSAIGAGATVKYEARGEWSKKAVTLTSRLCCSSVGGTSDEVIRQSFNGLSYTCAAGRSGGYADIPDKNVKNFIDPVYLYAGTSCNSLNDGQYAVVQSSFAGDYWRNRPEVKDHTGVAGSGGLFINAVGGVGQAFYKFNLDGLCNGTRYEFSAWYASLAATNEIKPNIEFDVMNGATKVESVTTGIIPVNEQWYQAQVTFVTPATGNPTYTLQLVNLVAGSSGNDLMIDDIVVKKCTPFINLYQDGTKNSELDVCSDIPVSLKINTYYDLPLVITGSSSGIVYYQWMKSTSPNGPWTLLGTPETTGSYSAIPVATTTYYRAKVSADMARAATGQPPLASECGNDGMTSPFKLTKGGNFTVPPITGTTAYCVGSTMTLTGNSSTGDQWEWRKGASFAAATVIPGYAYSTDVTKKLYSKTFAVGDADNYYFKVKLASGCEGFATIAVTAAPVPTATIGGTTAVCQNATAPNITFTGANGTAPYTFTYNIDGGTDKTITTVSGNSITVAATTSATGVSTYTLTDVKDASATACANTITGQTAKITVNALPTATISGTTTVQVNAPSPDITFTGANGTAPYTFTYNINGGTNKTVTTVSGNAVTVAVPTATGGSFVYNLVSVKDAGTTTCSSNSTGSATITISDKPGAAISGTAAVCQNVTAPVVTFTGSNGTAPYTFTYNINGGTDLTVTTVTGNSVTVSAPTGTIGAFVYTITQVKESSATPITNTITGQSITITVNDLPTINGTASVCKAGTTQLTGSGTAAGSNAWVSATTSVATVDNTGKVTGLSAGTSVITYTNNNGCSKDITITVNDLPTITGTASTCQGSATQLTGSATAASSNAWVSATTSVATVDNTGNVTGVSGGTSVITYTNNNGCSKDITVTVNPLPLAPTGNDNSRCGTGTVALSVTASGAGTDILKWYSDAALTTQVATGTSFTTANISATTDYFVTETSAAGCTSISATTVTATVNPGPLAPTGVGDSRCGTGTVALSASVNGDPTDVIKWYSDAGLTTQVATGTTFTTPSISATTDYYVTEVNTAGCASTPTTVTATINLAPLPPTGTGGSRCDAGTVALSATLSGDATDVIRWYSDAALTTEVATGTSFTTPSINATTDYYVTETNTLGCISTSATVTATINQVPLAPTGIDASRCGTGTVVLNATTSGGSTDVIKWFSDAGLTTEVAAGSSFNTPSITTTTSYYITETTAAGCVSLSSATVTATINQVPEIPSVSDVFYCQDAIAVPLTASGTNLTWYSSSGTGPDAPTPSTAVGGTTTYSVTSSNGTCESEKATIIVTINAVSADAGEPTLYVNEGSSVVINATATGNNITVLWSPGTYLNRTDTITPIIKPLKDKSYTLLVKSTDGCEASDQLDVVVLKELEIPNIISPNGDGINDTWLIKNIEQYVGATISVFNRYGQLIFESSGYSSSKAWDGTYKGKNVPIGPYYYIIKLETGKTTILSGSISVIR